MRRVRGFVEAIHVALGVQQNPDSKKKGRQTDLSHCREPIPLGQIIADLLPSFGIGPGTPAGRRDGRETATHNENGAKSSALER
jgi:hypothetical protein